MLCSFHKHLHKCPECSIEIIADKEPSTVRTVAYEDIVSELYKSTNKISDSDEEIMR